MTYVRIPADPGPGSGGGGGGGGGPGFHVGSAAGGNPDPAVGVEGDYYLDSDSGQMWLRGDTQYDYVVYQVPLLGGPLYRFELVGSVAWSQTSTVLGQVPVNFNGNTPSAGLAVTAVIAYAGQGTQPANFSFGFGASLTNVLSSRSLSGLTATGFSTFVPSGVCPLGAPGANINVAPVGGLVSGGGACTVEVLGVLR